MVDFLAPAPTAGLTPTPGFLADILHVELSTGARTDTTYGTDTYGSWDFGGKQAWERWDCDITALNLYRGRQAKLERNSPGVCYFTAVQIVPASWIVTPPTARPARIVTSTGHTVFYGIIETAVLNREYGVAEWQVTMLDDLARLGRLEVPTLTRPVEYLYQRINALLTAAGMLPMTDPPSELPIRVQAVNGSDRKILDEMGIAVDTWRAQVTDTYMPAAPLVDRTGWFTVRWAQRPPTIPGEPVYAARDMYHFPWRISPVPASHAHNDLCWLGDALNVEFSADLADVRNYLTFSSAGGTAKVYQDAVSVAAYGTRSYQRMDLIATPAEAGFTYDAAYANDSWGVLAMEPTPKMRLKTITVDCWNRPPGSCPLEELLRYMDVTHLVEVFLPDQDDAGGDIELVPLPPALGEPTHANYIFGMSWELSDREAILTLTLDCPIKTV